MNDIIHILPTKSHNHNTGCTVLFGVVETVLETIRLVFVVCGISLRHLPGLYEVEERCCHRVLIL